MTSRPAVTVALYIPYLACACRPGPADRAMERFNRDLLDVKAAGPWDMAIRVFALNQQFAAFKSHPVVAGILREEGPAGLPLVFVNGALAFKGAYPDREALEAALGAGAGRKIDDDAPPPGQRRHDAVEP